MIKIYYFSGTGNSLWSAKKLLQMISIHCELHNIGIEAQKDQIIIDADSVVIIFPSYAYGLPRVVHDFVKKAVFKTSYVASFVTYGTKPGGSLAEMSRMLKKKGIKKLYFGNIVTVENYLAIFGVPNEKIISKRKKMQEEETKDAYIAIMERRENTVITFRPFSLFVSFLFCLGIKIFYKWYKLNDKCNGCGICEKICPVSAIVMQNERPVFTNKCEHCQACINNCPLRAIQFGRVKFDAPGYRHPDITIAELMSYNSRDNT